MRDNFMNDSKAVRTIQNHKQKSLKLLLSSSSRVIITRRAAKKTLGTGLVYSSRLLFEILIHHRAYFSMDCFKVSFLVSIIESIIKIIYSYCEKGCRKKCLRDNPKR